MEKYLVGSQALNLNRAKDADYVILVDGNGRDYCVHTFEDGEDRFYLTKANLDSYMNFEREFCGRTILRYAINYQYDKRIISADFPHKYDILSRRENYVEMLKWIVDNKALNFDKSLKINDWKCSAVIYHVAYLTFILENNEVSLSAEQIAQVQKIHDKQMPVSFLDELAEKIKNL